MVFNSINYLLFLLLVTIIYYLTPHRFRWITLLAASIVFYWSFVPVYLLVLIAVILLNYFAGLFMESTEGKKRKRIYLAGIVGNIAILAFFKYYNFLEINFVALGKILDLNYPAHVISILLPLGLSFFSFSAISYLIELKRKKIPAEKHLGIFSAYLLFFPKVLQGPIERPQNFIPQLRKTIYFEYEQTVEGLKLILWGYFKKLVVADRLAIYVNAVYGNGEQHSGITFILATFFYSFQIYADFSAYSDIAMGSSKILGFTIINNFNRPYFSTTIKEFWSRWHISLSSWLRDYLFLPLAFYFSKKLPRANYLNIQTEKLIYAAVTIITFALCGLWHGEGIKFLIWGTLFGVYLSIGNFTAKMNRNLLLSIGLRKKSKINTIAGAIMTFGLVTITWVFFRANTTIEAIHIILSIIYFNGPLFLDKTAIVYSFIAISFLLVIEIKQELEKNKSLPFKSKHWLHEHLAYGTMAILILLLGVFDGGQFIYFQF